MRVGMRALVVALVIVLMNPQKLDVKAQATRRVHVELSNVGRPGEPMAVPKARAFILAEDGRELASGYTDSFGRVDLELPVTNLRPAYVLADGFAFGLYVVGLPWQGDGFPYRLRTIGFVIACSARDITGYGRHAHSVTYPRNCLRGLYVQGASRVVTAQQEQRVPPPLVDYCDVVRSPRLFTGQIVVVRAHVTPLEPSEFGILGDCWPPMLLVFPNEVPAGAPFAVEATPDLESLRMLRERFAGFEATFDGRVDWIEAEPEYQSGQRKLFGRSNQTLRFVLRRVTDSTITYPLRR